MRCTAQPAAQPVPQPAAQPAAQPADQPAAQPALQGRMVDPPLAEEALEALRVEMEETMEKRTAELRSAAAVFFFSRIVNAKMINF